ncbi:MAG TPA: tRNA uridine-5-carboxymethylaminomethyl(34) synthesis GTPase MnmE [Allosphingosinicella sp.]|uniref:tRNA uridine-5-carboxymethylaminomethyl(34) synthesis GTPase MnmE n=1 Tax=Allosphingosinicella sp. TaxID=2823234 RepID=UPI002ED838F1
MTPDTIFALSSGSPPAAIAVVRISGPHAREALVRLGGRLPEPRVATLRTLKEPDTGEMLDRALLLWFPGPASATGEDLAELHLHGGRSVVAAVLSQLSDFEELRQAEPGEFTRRAFENGRIDLTEAEGLSDLLMAETEGQRRSALAMAGGALSRRIEEWQRQILALAAQVEAALDFSDEDDVEAELSSGWRGALCDLVAEIRALLERPPSERLREGVRVVIAGPPNAGKSTLLNALAGREAAITSPVEGTTRDVVEAPTALGGVPFLLTDTAGLRESGDEVEVIGVARARERLAEADLVLWLGDLAERPPGNVIAVKSKADLDQNRGPEDIAVSAVTGEGLDELTAMLRQRAGDLLPQEGEVALNRRHRRQILEAVQALEEAREAHDLIVTSEALRQARLALDRITGRAGVEDMLDALFGTFCIGK